MGRRRMEFVIANLLLTLIAAAGSLVVGALVLNRVPLGDSPGTAKRLWTYLSTHVAETRRQHVFPELELRCYRVPPGRLHERVEHVVNMLGWELVETKPAEHTLHAVVTSQLLKFKDDVEIKLVLADCGTELHVRSSSRVGRGDFGANAHHVMELHHALERLL